MLRLLLVFCIVFLLLVIGVFVVFFFVFEPADRSLLFTKKETLQIDSTTRSYRVINGNSTEPRSLIIGLHGFQDRALWLGAYSGLHLLAEKENVTVVLPDGKRQSWNGVFCCGWAYANNANDVEFIDSLITQLKSDYRIDESRIYIIGFSNGGLMAQRMLAERPDTFAAGASFMSGVGSNEQQLDISRAQRPLLLVNGTQDMYVPVEEPRNMPGFNFIPALQTADIWATQLGLQNRIRTQADDYTEYRWNNSDGTKSSRLILKLYDSQHRWPDWRFPHFPNTIPESTQAMWRFLKQHTL